MFGNKLKVWGEDLIAKTSLSSTVVVESERAILSGGTNGGLIVRIFALDTAKVAGDVVVTLKAANTENGTYKEVASSKLTAGDFDADDILGEIGLPVEPQDNDETPMWYKAFIVGNSGSSGEVRITPNYLAR